MLARRAPASRTHNFRRGRENQLLEPLSASLADVLIYRHGNPPSGASPRADVGETSIASLIRHTLYQTLAGRSRNRCSSSAPLDAGRGGGQKLTPHEGATSSHRSRRRCDPSPGLESKRSCSGFQKLCDLSAHPLDVRSCPVGAQAVRADEEVRVLFVHGLGNP